MRLIDDLCGLAAGWEPSAEADFAGAVQSSNASLIPAELVIDLELAQIDSDHDRDLLVEQCKRQVALLASDRRVVAMVCALGHPSPAALDHRLDGLAVVRERCADLLVRDLAVLFTTDLATALPAAATLARAACQELVLLVPSSLDPVRLGAWLADLRVLFGAHSRRPAVSVWLRRATASGAHDLARCAALLDVCTGHVDALHLLPLLLPAADPHSALPAPWPAADYAPLAARILDSGWPRSAPGLYRAPQAVGNCYLATLLRMYHQVDVLGIGAAATSRFPPFCMRNHATPSALAADLQRGGLGIADSFMQTPVRQLLSEVVASLAGGATVDLGVVAAKYRRVPAPFRAALDGELAHLIDSGALTAAADGSVRVAPGNDHAFGVAVARLHALILVTPSATVRMFRPRNAERP